MMLVLDLSESIDQLAMANSVNWNGHVLMKEDGDVLRRALDLEVEDQRGKGQSGHGRCMMIRKCEGWLK